MITGRDQHLEDWAELAVDYLDGRVSEEEKAAIERHLTACPLCARRLERQQAVIRLLQQTPLADPPEDLEYRTLGELVFPGPGSRPVFLPSIPSAPSWSTRLFRRLRPWVPVGVAVVALLGAVVGYGIARSGVGENVRVAESVRTFDSATAAGSALSEAQPELATPPVTTASTKVGSTSDTSVAATTTDSSLSGAGITDRRKMVKGLEAAQGTAFLVFKSAAPDKSAEPQGIDVTASTAEGSPPALSGSPALSVEQTAEVVSQIVQFSGLEPLEKNLWLSGPTFAAFLPRIDAEEIVDLVRSIATSVRVSVMLLTTPPARVASRLDKLLEAKDRFPLLEASRAPQPATWGFVFTTSTTSPTGEGASTASSTGEEEQTARDQGPSTTHPYETGDYLLLIIYLEQ